MAGVAERRAESARFAGPDVRCTPDAAQGLELEMRRRLEALGKTHDADSEALDTWATDAATADPLSPPVSPRGRTAGFSGLDGAWLKGFFVSPQVATPALPAAAAGASGGALATPVQTPVADVGIVTGGCASR